MTRFALLLLLLGPQDPDVESLIKQLGDESLEIREKAVAALVGLGDKAEEKLKARLATAEGEFKARLEGVLRDIDNARRLRAVFPPLRRVSLDVKGLPVRDVLDRLKKETGLPIDDSAAGDKAVTVSLKEALPLEALDAVCRAADLEYLPGSVRFGAKRDTIILHRGHTGSQRAFAGPMVINARHLSVNGDSSRAQILITQYWPPGYLPSRLADWDLTSARDDQGNDLRLDMGLHGARDSILADLDRESVILLKGPAPEAKSVTVKGRGAILFPVTQDILSFKPPGDCLGQEKKSGLITVRLETAEVEENLARFKIKVTQEGGDLARVGIYATFFSNRNVRLVTAGGIVTGNASYSASNMVRGGMNVDLEYRQVTSPVTALEFVFDTEEHRVDFEFELKDIPLPK
jgi:hypothetical protein